MATAFIIAKYQTNIYNIMKQLIYLLLFAVCTMAAVSCKNRITDYENLSKEELTQLHNDGDVEATLQLGRLAIHEMNMEEAKSYFENAASKENPKGLHNLALVNIAQREMDEGVANLERAIKLGFDPSKGVLATVLITNPNKSRYDEGLELAKEAASEGNRFGYLAMAQHYVLQGHKQISKGDDVDTNLTKSIEAGSSLGVYVKVITMLNGGYTAEEVVEEIKRYQTKYPKVVSDLIATCNGDMAALATPYYQKGFQGIEDMME